MPEFIAESWLGLYAPKGVPPRDPGQAARGGGGGAGRSSGADEISRDRRHRSAKEDRGGDRMLEIIKSDVVRWSEVVKKAGGVEAKP